MLEQAAKHSEGCLSVLCTTFATLLYTKFTKSRHENSPVTGDIIIPDHMKLATRFVLMLLNNQAKESAGVNRNCTTMS